MPYEFEDGDRVRVVVHYDEDDVDICRAFDDNSEITFGLTGTVLDTCRESEHDLLVAFDTDVGGHDASRSNTDYGTCWWISSTVLTKYNSKLSVMDKIKELDTKFEERKSNNANHLPVQDGKSKCKVFGHKLASTESVPF